MLTEPWRGGQFEITHRQRCIATIHSSWKKMNYQHSNIREYPFKPKSNSINTQFHSFRNLFVYIFSNELFFLTWSKCTVGPQAHKRFESLRWCDQTKNWHVIISLDTLRTKNSYFMFVKGKKKTFIFSY